MVYRRWISAVGALLMVASVSLPDYRLSPSGAASVTVVADFGAPVDYPLVKTKFGVFNSCIVPCRATGEICMSSRRYIPTRCASMEAWAALLRVARPVRHGVCLTPAV
jgi:hypothetical protein